MKSHAIRWWGEPVEYRLRKVAERGQAPLVVERKCAGGWQHIARVASVVEAERVVAMARAALGGAS